MTLFDAGRKNLKPYGIPLPAVSCFIHRLCHHHFILKRTNAPLNHPIHTLLFASSSIFYIKSIKVVFSCLLDYFGKLTVSALTMEYTSIVSKKGKDVIYYALFLPVKDLF